jgi:large repetitive protein
MNLSPTWRTLALLWAIAAGLASSVPAYADEADLVVTPITPGNVLEGKALLNVQLCSFTDADDPSATAASFTASINWGDGTTSIGTIVANGNGGFLVTGNHTYADELTGNTLTTTITQINEAGGTSSRSPFNVGEAETLTGSTFAASEGIAFSGNVASFTDLILSNTPSDFTALINWGDGTTSVGTISSVGAGLFDISGNHTYAGPGIFTVTSGLQLDGFGDDSVISTADVAGATSTPEPSSGLLLGAGLGLLLLMVRRQVAERSA